MNADPRLVALQTYFDLMSMNGGARAFRAAADGGVFAALGGGARTPQAVAAACGLQERPAGLLLEALCALGAAVRQDGGYAPAPVMQFLSGAYPDFRNWGG
jgi:hypothetical protein